MTEAEWLACADPQPMLQFLHGKASDRKLRLFAVACCRRLGPLLADPRAQDALEVAARFADGLVGDQDRSTARKAAQQATESRGTTKTLLAPKSQRRAASAVYYATARDATEAAWNAPRFVVEAFVWRAGGDESPRWEAVTKSERAVQTTLLRDIFGNPFLPSPAPFPRGAGGDVAKLATAVAEERTYDRLPILADALEEAGCTDAALLGHCRGPGPHVRGCWAVDLVLGKDDRRVASPSDPGGVGEGHP
jgi:hypothetical protein